MEKLIGNLSSRVKNTTHQGRDFLVAPVSMLLPGVFAGSSGPILYEEADIKASVAAWNARPIHIGHPEDSAGYKVSGCTPESLDTGSIGMVLNARFNTKTKKLQGDCYFDVARLAAVKGGDTVHAALLANQKLEVSTGLFVEALIGNGTHEGKEYVAKAANYKPDHLAIILEGEGACSMRDGAGLLVNKAIQHYEAALQRHIIVNHGNQYFKQNCEITSGEVILVGELMPMASPVIPQNKKQENMERKDLISKLGETHADFVTNMSEDQFKAFEKALIPAVVAPVAQPALVVNSLDKLLALADAGLANQVKDAMTAAESARTDLIASIVTNSQAQFTKEELASFSTAHLSKMAKMAVAPDAAPGKAPVYAGQAFVGNSKQEAVTETGFGAPSTY